MVRELNIRVIFQHLTKFTKVGVNEAELFYTHLLHVRSVESQIIYPLYFFVEHFKINDCAKFLSNEQIKQNC